MRRPHVVVIPYPEQGHVLPLMSFSQYLAQQGIQITFINTEYNNARIINSMNKNCNFIGDRIKLVSVPDGLEDSPEDRNIPGKLSGSVLRLMPAKVEELIRRMITKTNSVGGGCDTISCVLADQSLGWALEIAAKFGIKRAAFCPAAAASLVLGLSIQKLVDDGVIAFDGTPRVNQRIRLAPGMPEMETSKFVWVCLKNKLCQKNIFELMLNNNRSLQLTDWLLCNSVYELEPAAFGLGQQIWPIGPIGSTHVLDEDATSAGSFRTEERECLDWLDRKETGSVIYVAFGSFGLTDQHQLEELAMGLELTNRPVLWATGAGGRAEQEVKGAKVVTWAPQRAVLGHRAVGCFVSHCGWNSTMEGAGKGVPFLCWPIFADQFINMTYINQVWKNGLVLEKDEGRGLVLRSEVKKKVDEVMGDGEFKKRAMEVKDIVMKSVGECGMSSHNLNSFVQWIKTCC